MRFFDVVARSEAPQQSQTPIVVKLVKYCTRAGVHVASGSEAEALRWEIQTISSEAGPMDGAEHSRPLYSDFPVQMSAAVYADDEYAGATKRGDQEAYASGRFIPG